MQYTFTLASSQNTPPHPRLVNGWLALFYPLYPDSFAALNIHLDQYGKWLTQVNGRTGSTGDFYDLTGQFNNYGGFPVSYSVDFDRMPGPSPDANLGQTHYGPPRGSALLFGNDAGFLKGTYPASFTVNGTFTPPYTIQITPGAQQYRKSDPEFTIPYGIYNCPGQWDIQGDRAVCSVEGATYRYSFDNTGALELAGTATQTLPEYENKGYCALGDGTGRVAVFTDRKGSSVAVVDEPMTGDALPPGATLTSLSRVSWEGTVPLSASPRTNLCPASVPQTSGWWWVDGSATISATTPGPNGGMVPCLLMNASSSWTGFGCGAPSDLGGSKMRYFDVKDHPQAGRHSKFRLGNSTNTLYVEVDLADMTILNSTYPNVDILPLANGFYRVRMWGAEDDPGVGIGIHAVGNNGGGIAVAGIMDTPHAYGEYIPTSGSAATRTDYTLTGSTISLAVGTDYTALRWSGTTISEDGRTVDVALENHGNDTQAREFVEAQFGGPLPAGVQGFLRVDVQQTYTDKLNITSADDGVFDWATLPQEVEERSHWAGLKVSSPMRTQALYHIKATP